ncbi:MAG: hypothetical protein JW783_03880 [Bacteroidales bacterium]|nr:hypothetical protein [Bacteroidales bacterium]MBN2748135.1 hypothetical protein [Bacteroidales bacterium]
MKYVLFLMLLIAPLAAFCAKQVECGKHEVDCTGKCGRFIDKNGDGFCDIGGLSANQAKILAKTKAKPYSLILISAITLALYIVSSLFRRLGFITKATHYKLWNVLLLITFLVSGILGLVLVAQINYKILGDWYSSFLYLHVEFGIAMAIVSIFHALWHFKYYAKALGLKSYKPRSLKLHIPFIRKSA